MLRLADNGADEVAWFRVLQLVEGVGPGRARASDRGDGAATAEPMAASGAARMRRAARGGPARGVARGARTRSRRGARAGADAR